MDNNKNVKNDSETMIDKIEKIQKELPNLVLPNMGIIDIDNIVDIDGRDYIKHKSVKED